MEKRKETQFSFSQQKAPEAVTAAAKACPSP